MAEKGTCYFSYVASMREVAEAVESLPSFAGDEAREQELLENRSRLQNVPLERSQVSKVKKRVAKSLGAQTGTADNQAFGRQWNQ